MTNVLRIIVLTAGFALIGATATADDAVHTNKSKFRIPYRFNEAEMERLGAREVRLYVSTDRGLKWKMAQSVAPATARFLYEADGDGEYWFSVRTIDRAGGMHPATRQLTAGLKVVVDTVQPQLDVKIRRVRPDQVRLSWQGRDAYLDVQSIRLEFQQGQQQRWLPVRVVPQAAGQTAWNVPAGTEVAVRGTIADLAGNTVESSDAIVSSQAENDSPFFDTGTVPLLPPDELDGPIASRRDRYISQDGGSLPQLTPLTMPGRQLPSPQFTSNGSQKAERSQSFGNSSDGLVPDSQPDPIDAGGVRTVGTKQFTIDYQIDDVGPSGIGAVEFFVTQDEGRTWFRYGVDEDRESPFEVEVPSEGAYGFSIRVRSGVGLVDSPPQPGEDPDIAIVVDLTGPKADLFAPEQGRGKNFGRVLLRWTVDDPNPTQKCVSLAYSASPEGPWEPITPWMEDRGGYLWELGTGLPERVFVRLNARDRAGNVTRVVTPEPLTIDLSRPKATILKVAPVR
ncbi:hypothetical protein [Stratiformator vulcanicus]|uniref:Ser-Thr-rich glycosyl-phosphatidyl-inositol-anchored membrane family protein n=1 Tax=Stratiformator vulcanicus TaxID=2527980 RepID=A0A517R272_9PLAN|nr:hypothetical protein [Stratiformator vulcanicus]QDT37972.1 hypothetical protein Pan189_23560 [Stratiformator vulcanicus]